MLANAIRRDLLSCKMISNTLGFKSFLQSHSIHSFYPPSRFPPWPLVLTQTTANIINARHCNPSPSSPIFSLLNMHTPSKARIPQVIIIPRHQPFISPLQSYLAKLLAQRKNYNNQPSSAQNPPSTLLSLSHIYIADPFVWTFAAISSPPPSVLLPPFFLPPPFINTAPCLTIIHVASFLHSITPLPREKPPHALSTTIMERFRLQKWRLINKKQTSKTFCVHTSEVTYCLVTMVLWMKSGKWEQKE